jgi:hypothetical protein
VTALQSHKSILVGDSIQVAFVPSRAQEILRRKSPIIGLSLANKKG